MKIGVLGSGTMGSGIAQVAATAGHRVVLFDTNAEMLDKAKSKLQKILARLVEKEKITENTSRDIFDRIEWATSLSDFTDCGLIIEAIIENLDIKQKVFKELENIVSENCVLATNTSSLSVTSIAGSCQKPERVLGIHFFNPAPLMPLVEIIPAVQTNDDIFANTRALIDNWGKETVAAKDTPGFIVNRLARPFYGEAIRIYEEGFADIPTIDWAMKEIGGFRMGPFELMDFIGNDINYTVTETVFKEFFYDPRYKPSFTQKRMVEAGWLGRKTQKGYYDYSENTQNPEPNKDSDIGHDIFIRILVMLINEAAEALFLNIASKEDLDLAMTKGVNYPKGLLKWADELGIQNVLDSLEFLHQEYGEDRYRPSPILRQLEREHAGFYFNSHEKCEHNHNDEH
ncbi:MAG: 3-hydroxybutyryl-CoA dehydrogenase [Flavobacteriales bacterium]|nr:MAG: 3-hydroxybutyryl-CoA dehydrogenase [Flavobacteriales bacterium]